MDKHSIETIELEMAVLFRRLTSITTFKKSAIWIVRPTCCCITLHLVKELPGSRQSPMSFSWIFLRSAGRLPHWRVRGTSPGYQTLWTGGLIRCRLRRRAKRVWKRTGRSGRR